VTGQPAGDDVQAREQNGRADRRDAVGRDQAQLVGGLDLIPANQVRHRSVLRRVPEQADTLHQKAGHEQQDQLLVIGDVEVHPHRDRHEEHEAQQVRGDHRQPTVEPVGEKAGNRAEHNTGQQTDQQHHAEGVVLALVATRQGRGERGGGQQTKPVTQTGQRRRVPEPTERSYPKYRPHRSDCARAARLGRLARAVRMGRPLPVRLEIQGRQDRLGNHNRRLRSSL
jgi:hypothetical protein